MRGNSSINAINSASRIGLLLTLIFPLANDLRVDRHHVLADR
jgi:hypothetical protein